MAPGLVAGSLVGPQIVGIMSTALLSAFFGVVRRRRGNTDPARSRAGADTPAAGRGGLFAVGSGIGVISSMVGAGGAFLLGAVHARVQRSFAQCGGDVRRARAADRDRRNDRLRLRGRGASNLPPWSIGDVYMPALLAIVVGSVACAPIGARAAHRWPVARLRQAFARAALRARRVHAVEGLADRARVNML